MQQPGAMAAAAPVDPRPPQYRVAKHGDERDGVLVRLNHLQAQLGAGVSFCELVAVPQGAAPPALCWFTQPVDRRNAEAAFKAVVYNLLPENEDAEGRMALRVALPVKTVADKVTEIAATLQAEVSWAPFGWWIDGWGGLVGLAWLVSWLCWSVSCYHGLTRLGVGAPRRAAGLPRLPPRVHGANRHRRPARRRRVRLAY